MKSYFLGNKHLISSENELLMNKSPTSLISGRYMHLKYREKNFQSTFVRKMSRGRCYRSRQLWGKAANPLHMLALGGSVSPLRVSLSRFLSEPASAQGEFYTGILWALGQQLSQSDWNAAAASVWLQEGRAFRTEWLFELH